MLKLNWGGGVVHCNECGMFFRTKAIFCTYCSVLLLEMPVIESEMAGDESKVDAAGKA
jgi:uncharacterized Zn finger protein (UPF0148 family)